jgi:hypothetical protein
MQLRTSFWAATDLRCDVGGEDGTRVFRFSLPSYAAGIVVPWLRRAGNF